MARKCKNGRLRSGKGCRKTKCTRKLTKKGFCPKGASSRKGKKKKRGGGGGEGKLWKALRAQARYELGFTTRVPSGLIGDRGPETMFVTDMEKAAAVAAAARATSPRRSSRSYERWTPRRPSGL